MDSRTPRPLSAVKRSSTEVKVESEVERSEVLSALAMENDQISEYRQRRTDRLKVAICLLSSIHSMHNINGFLVLLDNFVNGAIHSTCRFWDYYFQHCGNIRSPALFSVWSTSEGALLIHVLCLYLESKYLNLLNIILLIGVVL